MRNRGGSSDAALDCFDGPAMFSATADHGQTWSTPKVIVPTPTPNTQTIDNELVVGPSGTLYDFFTYIDQSGNFLIQMVSSPDGSAWSAPKTVNTEDVTIGVNDPRDGAPLRTGAIIPQPAVDPHSGQLYVVWEDNRDNTTGDQEDFVLLSTSTDGGTHWTTPALVNDPKDIAAFTPAIAILPNGSAVIQYYTFPNHLDKDTSKLPTTLDLRATNGPGTSFTHKEKSVDGAFNSLAAPFALGGYFTGDYEGIALGKDANSVQTFADEATCNDTKCDAVSGFDNNGNPIASNAQNPTDTYSQRVNPS
ncbi:MAG: exo-alpha-sialidase [Candidatus Dormibacteraeota bacterium]|nr:exo-alpha-sialidase [Candidatus Dormibacteraeota bacterium]